MKVKQTSNKISIKSKGKWQTEKNYLQFISERINSPPPPTPVYTKLLEMEEKKTINLIEKGGQEVRIGSSQMILKHM